MASLDMPSIEKRNNIPEKKGNESVEGQFLNLFEKQETKTKELLGKLKELFKRTPRSKEEEIELDEALNTLRKSRTIKIVALVALLSTPTVTMGGSLEGVLKAVEDSKQAGSGTELKINPNLIKPQNHITTDEVNRAETNIPGTENITIINGSPVEKNDGVYDNGEVKVTGVHAD